MHANITSSHPRQRLLFFVAQDMDAAVRHEVEAFVGNLASLRDWVNGAPRFIDEREEVPNTRSEDSPVETVGGFLEIYSALPPWTLPREVDELHLVEVKALVGELCRFSREQGLAFELELDDVFVGSITDGEMDRSLSEGLLGAWERHLS